MKYMKFKSLVRNFALLASLLPLLAGCVENVHDGEYPLPDGSSALVVGLDAPGEVGGIALYLFDGDGRASLFRTYDDPRGLASEYFPVRAGSYTIMALANADNAGLPQETTLPDIAEWLERNFGAYPGLLTASAQTEIPAGEVTRLHLAMEPGTGGIRLSTVRLSLSVPGLDLPDYVAAPASEGEGEQLRLVAEVYRKGTSVKVHGRTQSCALQADGTWLAELSLMPGDYDLRLWADWNGGYYNADDLGKVLVLTDNYVANGETDKKDAFYAAETLSVSEGAQDKPVTLERPFAKYRLVATDVEAYYNLIDKGEDLPEIGDLQVRVTYEGFFPTGFNVDTGKPNDALNTGIHYTSVPTVAEGYDAAQNRQVGADFVLTNGEESFVNVTIQMIDTNTGETVATVQHVKIPYKRGHLTTVTGHFLTAGKTPGGVQIDTDWGDDIVIEF